MSNRPNLESWDLWFIEKCCLSWSTSLILFITRRTKKIICPRRTSGCAWRHTTATWFCFVMSMSQSVYTIFTNNPLVVFTAKCNFVNGLWEDFMLVTSYDIHASHLLIPREETVFVVLETYGPLHFRLLNPLTQVSSLHASLRLRHLHVSWRSKV